MPRLRRTTIAITLFVISAHVPAARSAGRAAELTVDQIWRIASERQRRIRNVKATFRCEWNLLESYPPETGRLSTEPFEVQFAIDGDRRFQRRTPLLRESPQLAETRVYDGEDVTLLLRAERTAAGSWRTKEADLIGGKEGRCDNDASLYSEEVLQIPTQDYKIAGIDDSLIYPHCIRAIDGKGSYYRVLASLDDVDGVWCHVIESFFDRIWVDPKLDCAIRKRENLDRAPDGASYVTTRYVLSNFVEAAPGVVVPKKVTRDMLARRSWPARYHDKTVLRLTLDVFELGINNVTDDDFKVAIPAGASVGDTRTGTLYRIADQATGRIDELALESKKYVPTAAANRTWVLIALLGTGALALFLAAVVRRHSGGAAHEPRAAGET